jgi:CO/xanthine dehydrogenase Mo-binding subunit
VYDPLPVVDDPAGALSQASPRVHEGGNLVHSTSYARGDVSRAFESCVHVIDDVYITPHQAPAFIETESALAVPDDDGRFTIYAPGHYAEAERLDIAEILAIPPEQVRVVASPVGGSFGGKDQLHAQPLAALLAQAARRPVRLRWSREESFAYGVKRHPFRIAMRTGCDASGKLVAHDVRLLADTGAYAQHGPEVLDTAHENVQGPYAFEAVRATGQLVYTNNGVAGAMRGFGALQVHVALEQQIDRLAALCGVDPVSFRRKNLRADDQPGQLGQTLVAPSYAIRALALIEPPPPPVRTSHFIEATGVALVEKGEGFARGGPNHAAVTLELADSGKILVSLGLSELGQGLGDAAARIARTLLGVDLADIDVVLADTDATPDSGPIAASRGIGVAWRTIAAAAPDFREAVIRVASEVTGEPADRLQFGPGGVYAPERANRPLCSFAALATSAVRVEKTVAGIETSTGCGAAHAVFVACGAVATVRVDRLTGQVQVKRIVFIPVTGPIISQKGVRAQCEGGAALAVGFLTMEGLEVRGGRFLADNLDGYLVPTIADAPDVRVHCVTDLPPDQLGPRGVGEIGVNAAAPAIANAIMAATGLVCRSLPVDAAAILDAVEAQ